MCFTRPSCHITAAQAGQRLDVAVGLLFPAASARARRRLWDTHTIVVNGKTRPGGFMVSAGDEIRACPLADAVPTQSPPFQPWLVGEPAPHVVAEQQNLFFVYKPSGLHTSHLAGRGGPSLEAQLPALMPPPVAPPHPAPEQDFQQGARLVNRLDCGTSGLVVAARDSQCAAQWQKMENAGLCEKHYLTLLCGLLDTPLVVRNTLDVDSRRITKVLPTESTHPLRHSRFSPMGTLPAAALHSLCTAVCAPALMPLLASTIVYDQYTVVVCTIAKGARHQIRAHASHAGFPLWNDSLYGATPPHTTQATPSHHFLLHHGRLVLSGAVIQCLPVWFPLLPPEIQHRVLHLWQEPA